MEEVEEMEAGQSQSSSKTIDYYQPSARLPDASTSQLSFTTKETPTKKVWENV